MNFYKTDHLPYEPCYCPKCGADGELNDCTPLESNERFGIDESEIVYVDVYLCPECHCRFVDDLHPVWMDESGTFYLFVDRDVVSPGQLPLDEDWLRC